MITLISDGWSSGPVLLADSFIKRLRGLVWRSGHGLLLRGSSVHGIGMSHPLQIVGLDVGGAVIGVRTLRPMRMVWIRGAMWILELPLTAPVPPIGQTISVG